MLFSQSGLYIYKSRLTIVVLWFVLILLCSFIISRGIGGFKIDEFIDPHAESAVVDKNLSKQLGYPINKFIILYHSDTLLATSAQFNKEIQYSLSRLNHFSVKHHIIDPSMNPKQISKNNHTAYVLVLLDGVIEEHANLTSQFKSTLRQPKHLTMTVGGESAFIADLKLYAVHDLFRADYVAIPVAIITLLFVFGSFVAACLPVVISGITILIVLTILSFLRQHIEISVFSLNVASLLGLTLTLDYCLFIINRFRDELKNSADVKIAVSKALQTAGNAVFYSGLTVLISISTLLLFPVNFLFSIGIAGVSVVFISMCTSLIFLPALLSIIGQKINSIPIRFIPLKNHGAKRSFWAYLANKVMTYPFSIFLSTFFFLLLLGFSFSHVILNRVDPNILPQRAESRHVLQTFKNVFNENELTPILVVIHAKKGTILSPINISRIYDFAHHISKDSRVEKVSSIVSIEPQFNKKQYQLLFNQPHSHLKPDLAKYLQDTTRKHMTLMTITSKYQSNSKESFDLVKKIRKMHVGKNLSMQVTGMTASTIDTITNIYHLLFYVVSLIIIITYIILLMIFRSIVLPLKAILMNTLSIIASFGMLVFIFQEGHLSQLLDFKALGYTEFNLPILMFCTLFGISMDYEIFLLSYIREYYIKTNNNTESISMGLQKSGRIISSAALIIILVASSFIVADVVLIKALALGMAIAVAIDALIVRSLLVPATMRLLGKWNWYLPHWLDIILPGSSPKLR